MPSALNFVVDPALGMNTRLTGMAAHDEDPRCTQSASSALWDASSATLPSTPAVLRPALSSVTRRTLKSAFERDRSINFCRLRTRLKSPPASPRRSVAVTAVRRPRPDPSRCHTSRDSGRGRRPPVRSPRAVPSEKRSGLQQPWRPTCPSVRSGADQQFFADSPDPRGHPFGSGHQARYPAGSFTTFGRRGPKPRSWCSRRLSARRHWLVGSSCPAEELSLPHGQPTSRPVDRLDPDGVSTFHTHEQRPGWVPSRPRGRRCPPRPPPNRRPPPAVSQRHGPCTPVLLAPTGAQRNEASSRVHCCSPVRSSPSPVVPGCNRDPWASPRGFAPRRYQRRTPGWGQAMGTGPGLRGRHSHPSALLPASPLATSDFVSHFGGVVRVGVIPISG